MLEALAGKPPPDAIVGAVFDETEGNPFFVEEVFWHLVEERKIFDESGEFRSDLAVDELDVPESVRLVVGRRLERLGPEAQKVLAAAPSSAAAFPFTLLEAITDADAGRLLDIVEEAKPPGRRSRAARRRGPLLVRARAHPPDAAVRAVVAPPPAPAPRDRRRDRADRQDGGHHASVGDRAPPVAGRVRAPTPNARSATSNGPPTARSRRRRSKRRLRAIDDALSLVGDDDAGRGASSSSARVGRSARSVASRSASRSGTTCSRSTCGSETLERPPTLCWEMGYQYVWLDRFADAFAVYARGVEVLGDHRSPTAGHARRLHRRGRGPRRVLRRGRSAVRRGLAIARELGDDRTLGRVAWGRTMSNWSNGRLTDAADSGRTAIEHLRAGAGSLDAGRRAGVDVVPTRLRRRARRRTACSPTRPLSSARRSAIAPARSWPAAASPSRTCRRRPISPRTSAAPAPRPRGSREHPLAVGIAVARLDRHRPDAAG